MNGVPQTPEHQRVADLADPAQRQNGGDRAAAPATGTALGDLEAHLRRIVLGAVSSETELRAAGGKAPLSAMDRRRLAEATITRALGDHFRATTAHGGSPLTPEQERQITQNVLASVFSRLPALEALLERDFTDLFFNGPRDARGRHADGQEERLDPIWGSEEEMVAFVQDVARKGGRLGAGQDLLEGVDNPGGALEQEFNATHPVVDLRLDPSGARFSAVGPWITGNGTHIAIRRHPLVDADQDTLVRLGMYDAGLASFFRGAVRAGRRILIGGAPGVGKTTLLRAIAHELHPDTRLVQIEQNPELGLNSNPARHNHVLAWIERPANMEGRGAHTLADHARQAQRHYPDYVVVGEIRGAEVLGLLKALSLGVPGLTTMHATSSANVFSRLVLYSLEGNQALAPEYLLRSAAESLDLVVYLAKDADGRRAVVEVLHVGAYDETLQRPITDEWFVRGSNGLAVRNPNSPIPPLELDTLAAYGYDPSLHRYPGASR